jgi:hypothetical protein
MLSGMVASRRDPIGEVDRMADEFRSSCTFLQIGEGDDRAEMMRKLIVARVDENFDAIGNRVLRDVEIEAAGAGKKN